VLTTSSRGAAQAAGDPATSQTISIFSSFFFNMSVSTTFSGQSE